MIDDEITQLEKESEILAEKLTDPDITPDEYAMLSSEYTIVKRKISSLKVKRFLDGV